MLPGGDHDDAAITAAAALVFGWRFFHPYIRSALHLDGQPFAEVHDAVFRKLLALAER